MRYSGGKLALFNLWSYELSLDDIQAVNCLTHGDVASMDELSLLGFAHIRWEDVPCRPGEIVILSIECYSQKRE